MRPGHFFCAAKDGGGIDTEPPYTAAAGTGVTVMANAGFGAYCEEPPKTAAARTRGPPRMAAA